MPLLRVQFDVDSIQGIHERRFVKAALELLTQYEKREPWAIIDKSLGEMQRAVRNIPENSSIYAQIEYFTLVAAEYPGEDDLPSPISMGDLYNLLNAIVFKLEYTSQSE